VGNGHDLDLRRDLALARQIVQRDALVCAHRDQLTGRSAEHQQQPRVALLRIGVEGPREYLDTDELLDLAFPAECGSRGSGGARR
jgi:hypothetical protein